MQKIIDAIAAFIAWFTPARRRKAYRLAALIGAILVGHGVIGAEDLSDWLEVIAIAFGMVGAPALANRHVNDE